MKKALIKDRRREIKNTISRFISIMLMVALGVFVFVGLTVTAPIMRKSAEVKIKKSNMFHAMLRSSMGLENEDLEIMKDLSGVEYIEFSYDDYLQIQGPEKLLRISSLPKKISIPLIKEGKLPQESGQLALDYDLKSLGYEIGQEISFKKEKDKYNIKDDVAAFKLYKYKIVGFVETPEVLGNTFKGTNDKTGGTLDGYAYILEEDFNLDEYTTAKFIFSDLQGLKTYEKEYMKREKVHDEELKLLFLTRPKERLKELRGDIEDEVNKGQVDIADARKEIKEGEEKLEDAQKKISEGQQDYNEGKKEFLSEIASAQRKLNKGKIDLDSGKKELDENRVKIKDAEEKLIDGEKTLTDKEKELIEGKEEYSKGLGKYEGGIDTIEKQKELLVDGEVKLKDSRVQLDDAKKKIDDGEIEYNKGKQELEEKRPELEAGKKKYEESLAKYQEGLGKFNLGKEQYEQGLAQYNSGLAQYEQGMAKLKSAKEQITQAEAQIAAAEVEIAKHKATLAAGLAQAGLSNASEIDGAIVNLNNQRAELLANISQIKAQIEVLKKQVDPVTGQLPPEIQGQIAVLEAQLAQLESAIDKIDKGIVGLNQLKQLHTGIVQGEAELSTKKLELEAAKEEVAKNEVVLAQSKKKLEESKLVLDKAKAELDANEAKLNEGKIELDKGKAELDMGQLKFNQGEKKLQDAKVELETGKAKYELGEEEYAKGVKTLEQGRVKLDEGYRELSNAAEKLTDAKIKLDDGEKKLLEGKKEYADSLKEYNSGKINFAKGEADYNTGVKNFIEGTKTLSDEKAKGQKKLDDALGDIVEGKKTYKEKLLEFEDKKSDAIEDIDKGESEISDAKKILEILKQPKYTVLSRNDDAAIYQYMGDAKSVEKLSYIFPIFFYIIAMLVSLTTMTRMVDEHRVPIGTLKSLGYSNSDISKKYLQYGTLASLLGGIIGGLLGNYLLSRVIGIAYSIGSIVDPLYIDFYPLNNLLAIGIGVFCTGFVAMYVVNRSLRENAAELMRPKAPRKGNRIALERVKVIWNKMSFLQKVTARNIFRYKSRMVMTLFGVVGCTALIVLGFGVDSSVSGLVDKQFDQLTKYDFLILYQKELSSSSYNRYRKEISEHKGVEKYTKARFEAVTTDYKYGVDQRISLIAPQNLDFNNIIVLRDRISGKKFDLPKEGVVITEKLAEIKRLKIEDSLYIKTDEDRILQVKVKAITEGYSGHYMYMSPKYYTKVFGEEYKLNADLVVLNKYGKENTSQLISDFTEEKAVLSAVNFEYLRNIMSQLMDSIAQVVVIIILASSMLAMVVLYNLTNINISERIRELSTIKVLGFYSKEVTDYIYRETWSLTLLGIFIGFGVGKILHYFVMKIVVPDMAMLDPQLSIRDFVISAAITIIISLVVRILVSRKMKNIDMIEALKSVE